MQNDRNGIQHLQTIAEWDACRCSIPQSGMILLKYSPRCPISRRVEQEFDTWYTQLPKETAPLCIKIDVIEARALSRHLAQELGIRHESPQAIWLNAAGQVVWHKNHSAISHTTLTQQHIAP